MSCDTYRIIDRGIVIASGMTLGTALIMLKALFTEYWKDSTIGYTIEKEPKAECKDGESE
jgi:hypothetical protein